MEGQEQALDNGVVHDHGRILGNVGMTFLAMLQLVINIMFWRRFQLWAVLQLAFKVLLCEVLLWMLEVLLWAIL